MAGFQGSFNESKLPKHKIELHVHLEGCIRVETVWDLSQKKGIFLAESMEQLREKVHIRKPTTLANFLQPIKMYIPVIVGDADAIERIAYEFCEDAAKDAILYVEVRYSPHLMSSTHGWGEDRKGNLTPRDVVECVNRGLERGSKDFGIKIRTILCAIRGQPGWCSEVAQLCLEFRDRGVVGLDVAGDNGGKDDLSQELIDAYKFAVDHGINRTAHAGEDGPASQIRFVLDTLHSQRIGHGYHLVDDPALYARCLESRVHLETCPHSSMLTGAVLDINGKHPIIRFAEDGMNFSISRDDSTVTQKTLRDDYDVLREMGLSDVHLSRANFNAAHSCFLPDEEKQDLLRQLRAVYSIDRHSNL